MTIKTLFAAGLIGLSGLSSVSPVWAQESAAITAETVTDAQITEFVRAAIALEDLRKEYTLRMASAPDDAARKVLSEEADKEARALVEKAETISPDDYLEISRLSVENPDLQARVSAELDRLRTQKAEFEEDKQHSKATVLRFSDSIKTNTDDAEADTE